MAALTPSQVETIKATAPVLVQNGETITTKFYADMLTAHPELKNIFNTTHQATGHQAKALAGSLYAYAANIDNLGRLSPAVELICHKHASLYIRPHHYDIVGEYLLRTLQTVLGDAATPDIMSAWGAAYWQLANLMIGKEAGMHAEAAGWNDWQDFKITRKEKEADQITSFYLEPVDSALTLPKFKPGQYISVKVFVDRLEGGIWQARQYSLSDAPGKPYLRISVKKEPATTVEGLREQAQPGYISNLLHDSMEVGNVVKVSHPWGDFYFDGDDVDKATPVVLISAGVGLTCLNSILVTLSETSSRPVSWIQGARDSNARAFKKDVDLVVAKRKDWHTVYFLSNPQEDDVQGRDYDLKGRVDLDKIDREKVFTDRGDTLYFVCGPTKFMLDTETKLRSYGVGADRVKMELFGTGGVPRL